MKLQRETKNRPMTGSVTRIRQGRAFVVGITLVIVGICLVWFPSVAQRFTANVQARVGEEYVLIANHESEQRYERAVEANEAGDYSRALAQLTLEGTDAIARVRIPGLGVNLPVYASADDKDLARGAGWLPGTSPPVGGNGTHGVITAHSGMRTHRMFDPLPKVKKGDLIYVDVLGQALTYRVTSTTVDVPQTGTRNLHPQPGQDRLTLVTCTPYGVNTHRLLVTAQRTETSAQNAEAQITKDAIGGARQQIAKTLLVVPVVGGVALLVGLAAHRRRRALGPVRRVLPKKRH